MDASETIINSDIIENNAAQRAKGLTMITAAIFIVGEVCGTGVLSLPISLEQSYWGGLFMLGFFCVLSAFCGIILSNCWIMLYEKNPSLKEGVRDPYPVIAYQAMGKFGQIVLSIISFIQLFGVAIVFLLIASHNLSSLLSSFVFHFCDWTIAITLIMWPISMLGSPKDFWFIAVGAMLFTGIACVLILVQTILQIETPLPPHNPVTFKYLKINYLKSIVISTLFIDYVGISIFSKLSQNSNLYLKIRSFFVAFGTILFCFGGGVIFPTIQADMLRPKQFTTSVVYAYVVMLIYYVPVALAGYKVFGFTTKNNIIDNLNDNWIKKTILVLITGHLLTAFNIVLNPIFQGLEQAFNVSNKLSLKRFIVRTSVLVFVLFMAQSIPNFGPILSFIGGSTVSLTSFILPCIFYILLCRDPIYNRRIHRIEMGILILCIVISVLGGIASTYSSIDALFSPDTFKKPCYFNRTQ